MVAVSDNDGRVVNPKERIKDFALPELGRHAVAHRFPKWEFSGAAYRVKSYKDMGAETTFEVKLKNGGKTMRVKANQEREFL